MCQSRENGGVRCPIHRSDVMAGISIASRVTGLTKEQVQQIFHTLRREGRNAEESVTRRDVAAHRLGRRATNEEAALLADSQTNEPLHPAVTYALHRLVERSQVQSDALESAFNDVAQRRGWTIAQTRAQFDNAYAKLGSARNPVTQRNNPPTIDGVALEASFTSALNSLAAEQERGERLVQTFKPLRRSEILESVGYDSDSGRLEIRNRVSSTPFAYRSVPEEVYRGLLLSSSPDAYFLNNIRGVTDYAYANPAEAEEDAHAVRCDACGQFRASSHVCPTREQRLRAEEQALLEAERREQQEAAAAEAVARAVAQALREEAATQAREAALRAEEAAQVQESVTTVDVASETPPETPVDADSRELTFEEIKKIETERRDASVRMAASKNVVGTYEKRMSVLGGTISEFPNITDEQHEEIVRVADEFYDGNVDKVRIAIDTNYYNRSFVRALKPDEKVVREGVNRSHIIKKVRDFELSPSSIEERHAADEALRQRVVDGEAIILPRSARRMPRGTFHLAQLGDLEGRTATTTNIRAALRQNKELIIPIEMAVAPATVDYLGTSRTRESWSGAGNVHGNFAMKVGENGLAEITSSVRSLRCYCAQYQQNYHCIHVDYAHTHMANFAQQLLPEIVDRSAPAEPRPRAPRRPGLANPLGGRTVPAAMVERLRIGFNEADGDTPAHIEVGRQSITLNAERRTSGVSRDEMAEAIRASDPTQEQLQMMADSATLRYVRMAHAANHINQALEYGPVAVPLIPSSYVNSPEGTVIVERNEDGTVSIKHRNLQCYCAQYADTYDCPHTRAITDRAMNNWLDVNNTAANNGSYVPLLGYRRQRIFEAMHETGILNEEEALRVYNEQAEERERAEERLRAERAEAAEREYQERVAKVYSDLDDHRNAVTQRWQERNDSGYSNTDTSEFFAHYSEALETKKRGDSPLEFQTSGVLDGLSNADDGAARKFGVELEFDIDSTANQRSALSAIGRDLYAAGLTETPQQGSYHTGRGSGWKKWSFEEDCTVAGEIVSPIMTDTPEDWENLRKVVQIIKKHGGRATVRGGAHVHVSSGSYGESVAKHTELVRTVKDNHDVLFRLASDPKRGKHRGTQWCSPNINPAWSQDLPEDFNGSWYQSSTRREGTINLGGSGDVLRGHVEFRLWDSTLDEAVIQQHIKLSVAMTERAEQNVIANKGSKARSFAREIGHGKTDEQSVVEDKTKYDAEKFHTVNAGAAEFIGSLFRKNEDRKGIAALFAITNWQDKM